jgi:hypothetical protein
MWSESLAALGSPLVAVGEEVPWKIVRVICEGSGEIAVGISAVLRSGASCYEWRVEMLVVAQECAETERWREQEHGVHSYIVIDANGKVHQRQRI